MTFSLFEQFGSDEKRAVEGIAAMLDLSPPDPGEDPEHVARRMADWGTLQGPDVSWEAMWSATHAMLQAQLNGAKFIQMAEVGRMTLREYNLSNPKKRAGY